jgi:hypothetical protein
MFKKYIIAAFLLLFYAKNMFSQCLSGHFTVGGSSPDFLNVQAAIDTLVARGRCDSVFFDIRPGVYSERFVTKIGAIAFVVPIILQPDPNFTGEVRFVQPMSDSSIDSNFVIQIKASTGFVLKNLIFERTGSGKFARVVELNGGNFTNFEGCRFYGKKYTSTTTDSTQTSLISNGGNKENNQMQFTNCLFEGGSWGVFLPKTSIVWGENMKLTDCHFVNQVSGGFFARNQSGFEIVHCQFEVGLDSTAIGICFKNCQGKCIIGRNKIQSTGTGLENKYFSTTTFSEVFEVHHNFFICPFGFAARFSLKSQISNIGIQFVNNTVLAQSGLDFEKFEVNYNFDHQMIICGNIFDITTGSTYRFLTENETKKGSYYANCFVPNNSQYVFIQQLNLPKTWTFSEWKSGDQEVLSIQKNVAFVSNVDLHLAIPDTILNGRAVNCYPIYYNDFVDIDGDATTPSRPDIGADAINLPVSDGSLYVDKNSQPQLCGQEFAVTCILRNLGEQTLTSAKIQWTINGVLQPDYYWAGIIDIGKTDTIEIGFLPFEADTTRLLQLNLVEVNQTEDVYQSYNNQIMFVNSEMSGEYTIGFGGDFETSQQFQQDIDYRGVCGPLKIVFLSGYEFGGLHFAKSMHINSQNNVEITCQQGDARAASLDYLTLDDADNVFIHDLTFRTITGSKSDFLTIERCNFLTLYAVNSIVISDADSVKVRNCKMTMHLQGAHFIICNNLSFENNDLKLAADEKKNGLNVSLFLDGCKNSQVINNFLEGAVELEGGKKNYISKNEIFTSAQIGSAISAAGIGFYESDSNFVSNNIILGLDLKNESLIKFYDSNYNELIHNTLVTEISGTVVNFSGTCSGLKLNNNIIGSKGSGYAYYFNVTLNNFQSDYNDFFTNGPYLLFSISGTGYTTLSQWQSASSNEVHGVNIMPTFYSSTNLRLIGNQPDLAEKAIFSTGYSEYDIDNESRSAGKADIGADQFSGKLTDVALVQCNLPDNNCHGRSNISIKLKNVGNQTVQRVDFFWKINLDTLSPVVWKGYLLPGETSDWIKLGDCYKFDFQNNNLEIEVNESRDSNKLNNHLFIQNFTNKMGGAYSVGRVSDDFLSLSDAALMLANAGVCAPVTLFVTPALHLHTVFYPIPGSSLINNIHIEPNGSGVGTARLLTIQFNGGTFLTFNGLEMVNTYLYNQGSNIKNLTFEQCRFLNEYFDDSPMDSIQFFKNCIFDTRQIFIGGNLIGKDFSTTFENCKFGKFSSDTNYTSNALVINQIKNLSIKNCHFGIFSPVQINDSEGAIRICRNQFLNENGLGISHFLGSDSVIVENNFLSSFWIEDIPKTLVRHNSFFLASTNTLNPPPVIEIFNNCADIEFTNNLIKTVGTSIPFQWPILHPNYNIDYNNYNLGSSYGFWNGIPDLSAWQTLTNYDLHSTILPFTYKVESDPTGESINLHLASNSPNIPRTNHIFSQIPTDFDDQIRSQIQTALGADEPDQLPQTGQVWPGDCDQDKAVTTLDWLQLGVAIGQNMSGAVRFDQSISWTPKSAVDWADSVQNVNAKHADCNGDGFASEADSTAIIQNFNQKHLILGLPIDRLGAVILKIELPVGPYFTGQKIAAPVHLAESAESFYGLAFDLGFSENTIKNGSFSMDFNNSWLGSQTTDLMGFYPKNAILNQFQVALVRTDGYNVTNFGQIGTLHFEVGALADSIKLQIVGARGIQADGTEKPIAPNVLPTVDVISKTTDFSEKWDAQIFPNPTSGLFFIEIKEMSEPLELELLNNLGQVILRKKITESRIDFNLNEVPNGFYLLKIHAPDVFGIIRKLLIQR